MEYSLSGGPSESPDADEVAKLIAETAGLENPKRRYLVGQDAKDYAATPADEFENGIRRWLGFTEI